MAAIYEVEVKGFEQLQKAITSIEKLEKKQLDLQKSSQKLSQESNDLLRSIRALAADGYNLLAAALTKIEAKEAALAKQQTKSAAANKAAITSVKALAAAWNDADRSVAEITTQLLKQEAASRSNLAAVTGLTKATQAQAVAARELFIADQANIAALSKISSGLGRVSSMLAERRNLESGVAAAIAKRTAAEEMSLAIARQKHAVDQLAIRDAQLKMLANSDLSRDQSTAVLREMGYLTTNVSKKTESATKATSRWTQAHRDLHSVLRGLGAASNALFLTYGSIVPMLAAFGTAATGIKSLKVGAGFESEVKYIQALQEEGAGVVYTYDEIKNKLLEIKGVGQTPAELAGAVKEMVKAGISAQDALSGVADMAKFTKVVETDLATASSLVASQWLAWGPNSQAASRGVQSMTELMELLSYTVVKSKADMESMKTALSYVTSLSGASDASYTDLLALAGALHNIGVEGSMAGTTVRNALLKLQSGKIIEKLIKQFGDLGIAFDPFADASRTAFKQGISALTEFKQAADKLPPTMRATVTEMVFGVRGMNIAGLDFKATMDAMGKSVSDGTAGKVSDVMRLKEGLEQLQITIRKGELQKGFMGTVFSELSDTALFKLAELKAGVARAMAKVFDRDTVKNALDNLISAVDSDSFINLMEGLSSAASQVVSVFANMGKSLSSSGLGAFLSAAIGGVSALLRTFDSLPGPVKSVGLLPLLLLGPTGQTIAALTVFSAAAKYVFDFGGAMGLASQGVISFSDAIALGASGRASLIRDIQTTGSVATATAQALQQLKVTEAGEALAQTYRALDTYAVKDTRGMSGSAKKAQADRVAELKEQLKINQDIHQAEIAKYNKIGEDEKKRQAAIDKARKENEEFLAQMEKGLSGGSVGAGGFPEFGADPAAEKKKQEQILRDRRAMEKEMRDYTTEMMADGLDKELQKVANARADALDTFESKKSSLSQAKQVEILAEINKRYYQGLENASEEYNENKKAKDEKELRRKNKLIEDQMEAEGKMYDYLSNAGRMSAEEVFQHKKKALEAELIDFKNKTNNKVLIEKYAAEKTREAWKQSLSQGKEFSDGFMYSLMEAQDQLVDFGSLGKEVFSELKDGISSMYKALMKGEDIGEIFKNLGDTLLDTLLTRVSDTLSVKTIEFGTDILGGLFDSFGMGDLFGNLFGGQKYTNGAANVYVTNMEGGLLGAGGTEGGLLGSIKSGISDIFGPTVGSIVGKLASAAGLAGGAYGLYSGFKAMKEGNAGSGALQMGLGGVAAYKGAVGMGLLSEGSATALAKSVASTLGFQTAATTGATTALASQAGQRAVVMAAQKSLLSTGSATAASSGGSAAAGGAMAGLGAFAGAVGALGAIILGIKALMPGSPSTMERLRTSGATGSTFDASGLTSEMQSVTKAMHAAIPALGRVTDAAWDMRSRTLTTAEGMSKFREQTDGANVAVVRHTYTFNEATKSWEAGISISARSAEKQQHLFGAASAAAGATSSAANGLDSVANASDTVSGAVAPVPAALRGVGDAARGVPQSIYSLSQSMTGLGGAASATANAMASSVGAIRSAAGSIQAILSRSASQSPSYKKNGGRIGYATGGVLQGGSYTKDDLYLGSVNGVAQIAMGGEYIMPQKQTRKYLPILEGMRRQEYASGGQLPKSALDALAAYAAAGSEGPASIVADIMGKLAEFEMTDYQKSLYNVYKEYEGTRKQLIEAGGNNKQRQMLDKLRNLQVEQAELEPIREASEALSDFKKELMDVKDATYSTVEAQASLSDLLAKAKTGDFSGVDKISDLLGQIKLEKSNYATSLDYARAYWSTMSMVSELEKLTGVKAKVPGFATGGTHYGGLRVVGESGPELEYTGPSRIFNAQQLIDLTALIAEIRALRGDITAGNVAVATNTKKTADALRRFEIDGMPVKDAV